MANSKVQLADGTVLLDISTDTVSASKLLTGVTAHDKSGSKITGTLFGVGSLYATYDSTENPRTTLGVGTWVKVSPGALSWGQLSDSTWNPTGTASGIYVWKRTA